MKAATCKILHISCLHLYEPFRVEKNLYIQKVEQQLPKTSGSQRAGGKWGMTDNGLGIYFGIIKTF